VCHWRKRWFDQGLVGLYGEAKLVRPRTHDEERIAELLRTVLEGRPADRTHWTVRSAAKMTGPSKSTVARTSALFGVRPHRSRHFKLSTDPEFVDKVQDIVGLYLNPPDRALVLCVDEKTQIQALERSQPILPLGLPVAAKRSRATGPWSGYQSCLATWRCHSPHTSRKVLIRSCAFHCVWGPGPPNLVVEMMQTPHPSPTRGIIIRENGWLRFCC
jgi:hypothetical protein